MPDTRNIYLDYAAATPLDDKVLVAMQPYFSELFYNPSALYLASKKVDQALAQARAEIGVCLGARPAEIIFTAGGSEANNLAIHGVMSKFAPQGGEIIVSAIEHDSVIKPAANYQSRQALVKANGIVDLEALAKLINDKTVMISLMYANNEIGTIQPIKEVADLVGQVRKDRQARGVDFPIYLHSDACQAANYLDLHVSRLGVDMMTINGGKIYGPKQSAVLYVKAGLELEPIVYGGGQEFGLRSGTENVASVIGLSTALQLAQSLRPTEVERLKVLQSKFIGQLAAALPNCIINGSLKKRLPNNVHVTFPGSDNERLLMELDQLGIMAAAGSACSASSDEPSHVLRAIGLTDAEAQSSLRFTFGRQTDEKSLDKTIEALVKINIDSAV